MSLPVHLVPSLAGIAPGDQVSVEGEEAHHAVAVRRIMVGERVVLTDGRGIAATGAVASTGKRLFTVRVEELARSEPPAPAVTVVQALPKGERGQLAVEVLTEIGAARIVPWAASRSVAVWKGDRVEKSLGKWQATAREAAKQARRSWFPEVTALASTAEVAGLIGKAEVAVVLHEEGAARLGDVAVPESGELLLVVGPEGGVSAEEVATFEAAGALTVRLGSEVLRTSTAGLAAASALLARTPRWS